MPCARRENNGTPILQRQGHESAPVIVPKHNPAMSLFDPNELIRDVMHFQSNVFEGSQAHHNQLLMVARKQDAPKRVIIQRFALDVGKKHSV